MKRSAPPPLSTSSHSLALASSSTPSLPLVPSSTTMKTKPTSLPKAPVTSAANGFATAMRMDLVDAQTSHTRQTAEPLTSSLPAAAALPRRRKLRRPRRRSLSRKDMAGPILLDGPHLLEYLNRENSYADAFMAVTLKLRSDLSSEMKARLPPIVSTPPERWGPCQAVLSVHSRGKEYPMLCRKLEMERSS